MFKNHPSGLKILFFTEMWERFGFYLMLGILSLYMLDPQHGGLGFDEARTADIYGTFIALVYLTPFLGGIIADQFLGYRRSIILGALLMAAGYLGVGLLHGLPAFYASLGFIILGNGFFKPNMSTLVGRLYPEGSTHKDAGYNIFYMGINIGAFVCNFVAAILRNNIGWGAAFAAAGIGMIIGTVTFVLGQRHLTQAADHGHGAAAADRGILLRLAWQVILPAALCGMLGYRWLGGVFGGASTAAFIAATVPVLLYYLAIWLRAPQAEKGPIGALLSICAVVIVFWMIFHQNGSSLTYFANANTRREAGALTPVLGALHMQQDATIGTAIANPDTIGSYWRNVPPAQRPAPGVKVTLISEELFQSVNPFFVVFLTPLVVGFFTHLRRRNREPSTPGKIAWGMVITAVSTLIMVIAVTLTYGGLKKVSPAWLVSTYAVITLGELFLSPMGLALVSKLAPARVASLMMGGWFLATSIGNKMAGVLAGFWNRIPLVHIFWINCASALVAGVIIALLTPSIRRVMEEHERGSAARLATGGDPAAKPAAPGDRAGRTP